MINPNILKLSEISTPSFILDKELFINNIKHFQSAISNNFSKWAVGYSVKTNSLVNLINIAYTEGCKIEVVSSDEYELAILCGINPKDIIYNGPMKSKETFISALVAGGIVNIDTHREIEWLKLLPQDRKFKVGLRVNVDVNSISSTESSGDCDLGRFGFSVDSGDLVECINKIEVIGNIEIAGLHFHKEVPSRSLRFYKDLTHFACSVINELNLPIRYLDLGGGFFGKYLDKPTYDQYMHAIKSVVEKKLPNWRDITYIFEPGNAILADAFQFVSSVIDIKKINDDLNIVTIDGSRANVDPLFRKRDYLKDLIFTEKNNEKIPLQIIGGATCMEFDRLFELKDFQVLCEGDRIIFNNVGAYTMTLQPLFINYFPRVYSVSDGKIELIREKWSAKKFFN